MAKDNHGGLSLRFDPRHRLYAWGASFAAGTKDFVRFTQGQVATRPYEYGGDSFDSGGTRASRIRRGGRL